MSERFEAGCLNPTARLEDPMLGINYFRPESHIAQQSRRDKLRVPQHLTPSQHLQDLPNQFLHLPRETVLNPNLIQVRHLGNCDLPYNPAPIFSSEMLNFSSNTHVLLAQKDSISHQESVADGSGGLSSQQGCDWIMNYVNGSGSNAASIQNPLFVGGMLSSTLKEGNVTSSPPYLKSSYSGFQDVQSSLNNRSNELSSQGAHKQYGEVAFTSPSFYQNSLQDVVTSTTIGTHGLEMHSLIQQNIRETGHGSCVDGGNELVLLPSYGNQTPTIPINNDSAEWMNRPVGGSHQWNSTEEDFGDLRTIRRDSTAQGLSLSLSSLPTSELNPTQFRERFVPQDLPSTASIVHASQDSKSNNLGYFCSYSKSPIPDTSMDARRIAGPLGPFTGYATILKSSKFLKPARQLLDEICSITNSKFMKTSEISQRDSCDTVNADNEIGGRSGNSVSTSSFYSSTDPSGDCGGGSGSAQPYCSQFQRKKAKLLYMQEEVCRRYKQYHQQMQMVISAFESVAGLNAVTPYTSLALKVVSKHFRCLKNAISDELRHISKSLGEEFMSAGTTSRGDQTPRLRFIDQNFGKQKSSESLGFLEHQQHVWRPQRGLPERSVAVLRAWLFEHFLHPYPTDTDKHMLAAQTGLSRNQVSNWFINARVRLWKPMVEEIHNLETKGSKDMDLNSLKNEGKPTLQDLQNLTGNQPNNLTINGSNDGCNSEQWQCGEKRSRVEECQIPATVEGALMGFVPYQSGGAVSLTLGLRHNTECVQQQAFWRADGL
ncbi:uncharacterized protein LOC143859252 [Tasmannia lanceolata]|uniref:uncharacterized protein LOC143859252 n=1 Tax=Tasmannia lanceolata TaxID=3420 RepID=UPI004062EA70